MFGKESSEQSRDEVKEAIAKLKAQGVHDWEILSIWSEVVYEQGHHSVADTLMSAAYQLGKPIE